MTHYSVKCRPVATSVALERKGFGHQDYILGHGPNTFAIRLRPSLFAPCPSNHEYPNDHLPVCYRSHSSPSHRTLHVHLKVGPIRIPLQQRYSFPSVAEPSGSLNVSPAGEFVSAPGGGRRFTRPKPHLILEQKARSNSRSMTAADSSSPAHLFQLAPSITSLVPVRRARQASPGEKAGRAVGLLYNAATVRFPPRSLAA